MHKLLMFVLIAGVAVVSTSPPDSVSIPALKKAKLGAKMVPLPAKVDEGDAPDALTQSQIKSLVAAKLKHPITGVTDVLHLDSRNMRVQGKGSLSVFFPYWIKPEEKSIFFQKRGIVQLEFTARQEPTTYLVDFQVNVVWKEVTIESTAGDLSSETTLSIGKHHILLMVEATGGIQEVVLRVRDGYCSLKGVDISVIN